MSKAIDDIKKSKRGRPKADTEPVMVRFPADLIEAIETFRRDQDVIPTRPEAIRFLVRDHLIGLGYLENPPPKEDAN